MPGRFSSRFFDPRGIGYAALLGLLLLSSHSLLTDNLGLDIDDDDIMTMMTDDKNTNFEGLQVSHLSEVSSWPGIQPLHPRRQQKGAKYTWKQVQIKGYADRLFAQPLATNLPIRTVIHIPQSGNYRIWLGFLDDLKGKNPVTLTLSGANKNKHLYGSKSLMSMEAFDRPIRFDSEMDKMSAGIKRVIIWEYWDVELKPGATVFSLQSKSRGAEVDAILLSMCKSFVPSKSPIKPENNCVGAWYRYRITNTPKDVKAVQLSSFVHYLTPQYINVKGLLKRKFYSSMGEIKGVDGSANIKVGQWSDWINSTSVVSDGGRFLVDRLTVTKEDRRTKVTGGTCEVQLAWFPHKNAVLHTIRNTIEEGGWCRYLAPCALPGGYKTPVAEADNSEGVWGMRAEKYVHNLQSEVDALRTLMDSIPKNAIQPGKLPKRILMSTIVLSAPSSLNIVLPFLKKVGINAVSRPSFKKRIENGMQDFDFLYFQSGLVTSGTHCPLDPLYPDFIRGKMETVVAKHEKEDPQFRSRPHRLKMGDEIGPVCRATHVNGLPDCRHAFEEYLRKATGMKGKALLDFFGVRRLSDVKYTRKYRPDMDRYERRAYYYSGVFEWILTGMFYQRLSDAARSVMPNLLTRANYTPGGPLFAGTMSKSNWFALPRQNVGTAHMAEDWLSTGGGYTSQAGVQTETFYAAIMRCAVRKYGQPLDFYLVGACGQLDRKLILLAGGGIHSFILYAWGPKFLNADGCSQKLSIYGELNRGLRALAPAEDIIIDGRLAPRKVGVLYNRTNEIWNGGKYGIYTDRLYTFLALRHAHIPADLLLEEDLIPEILKQYKIIYLSGINLRRDCVPALKKWVENGGILVGSVGAASRDEFNDPLHEAVQLFGASQHLRAVSDKTGGTARDIEKFNVIDQIKVKKTKLTPSLTAEVVGLQAVLKPTTAESVATYKDGSCAAAMRSVGKGKVLLLGVGPGHLYAHNAPWKDGKYPVNYSEERRGLIAKPAEIALGRKDIECSEPFVDVEWYEHDSGIAVLLVDLSYGNGRPMKISLRTDRPVKSVTSTLSGPRKWQRKGDRIIINCQVPDPIDVLILK